MLRGDQKKGKKFLCALLAGALIMGEAVSVSASGPASQILKRAAGAGAQNDGVTGGTQTGSFPESETESGTTQEPGEVNIPENDTEAGSGTGMSGSDQSGGPESGAENAGAPGAGDETQEEPLDEPGAELSDEQPEDGNEAEAGGGEEGEEQPGSAADTGEEGPETDGAQPGPLDEPGNAADTGNGAESGNATSDPAAEQGQNPDSGPVQQGEPADTEEPEEEPEGESAFKTDTVTPGKDAASALELVAGIPVTAVKTSLRQTDWYKFTLARSAMVAVTFEQPAVAGQVSVAAWNIGFCVDNAGNAMYSKAVMTGDTKIQTVPVGLAAGTYYIRVEGTLAVPVGASCALGIVVEETVCETEPNNSLAQANVLPFGTVVTGSLFDRRNDPQDYYAVALPEAGALRVEFLHDVIAGSESAAVYQFSVLDKDGKQVSAGTSRGGDPSVRTPWLGLAAGTYYILVQGAGIDINPGTGITAGTAAYENIYRIKAEFTAGSWETEPNNSMAAANPLAHGTVINGCLTDMIQDPQDYYAVTLASPGALYVEFQHDVIAGSETKDVFAVTVRDKNGNELMKKNSRGGETRMTTPYLGLAAGTYYIEIRGALDVTDIVTGNTAPAAYGQSYQLKAGFSGGNWEQERNDTFSDANVIRSGTEYRGSIHKSAQSVIPGLTGDGDKDYYRIELAKSGWLQIKFSHEDTGSADEILRVRLYGSEYTELDQFTSRGTQSSITTPKTGLAAGTYYILVEDNGKSFTGNYRLKVMAKTASGWETEPNGNSATADRIKIGKTVTGVSCSTLDNDWFRFTLDKAAYLNFGISHDKTGSSDMAWYVTLLDQNGSRVSYKKNGYIYAYAGESYSESQAAKLPKGTYFLKVQAAGSAGVGREYRLSVNKIRAVSPKITGVKSTAYNKLKVSWNAVAGVENYTIYRSTSKNGTYEKIKTVSDIHATSWTDKKVTAGKTYYYKMTATVKTTGGSKTGGYSAAVQGKPVPSKVSPKVTAPSAGKLRLTWSRIAGADGYEIFRSTSKNGGYKKVKTITKGSIKTYTDSGLSSGKTYYYKVRAYRKVNGKKIYGSNSKIVSKKVK